MSRLDEFKMKRDFIFLMIWEKLFLYFCRILVALEMLVAIFKSFVQLLIYLFPIQIFYLVSFLYGQFWMSQIPWQSTWSEDLRPSCCLSTCTSCRAREGIPFYSFFYSAASFSFSFFSLLHSWLYGHKLYYFILGFFLCE